MSRKKWRKRLETMDADAWERICARCGRCCHERTVTPDGEVLAWGPPCPYLDPETRLCGAYEQRFSLGITCKKVTPRTLQRPHLLPPGCAYRQLASRLAAGERRARGAREEETWASD